MPILPLPSTQPPLGSIFHGNHECAKFEQFWAKDKELWRFLFLIERLFFCHNPSTHTIQIIFGFLKIFFFRIVCIFLFLFLHPFSPHHSLIFATHHSLISTIGCFHTATQFVSPCFHHTTRSPQKRDTKWKIKIKKMNECVFNFILFYYIILYIVHPQQ